MGNPILKSIYLIALILSVAWYISEPGWRPGVGSIGALAALVAAELADRRSRARPSTRQVQAELDGALFRKLLETLPSSGSIAFIETHHMGGAFKWARLDDLQAFHHEWDDVEHEFLSKRLEKRRKRLHALNNRYLNYLAQNTFPADGESGWQWVPPEWSHRQPEKFEEVVERLHEMSEEIVTTHQEMVRLGRRLLGVSRDQGS